MLLCIVVSLPAFLAFATFITSNSCKNTGSNFNWLLPPAYGRLCFTDVCLLTWGWYPSPSHNTSTGPISFGGVPHIYPIGSMSFLGRGVPQWLVPGPFPGGIPVWRGTPWPGQVQDGGTPVPVAVPHDGVSPSLVRIEYLPWPGQEGVPPARSGSDTPGQVRIGCPWPGRSTPRHRWGMPSLG